MNEQKPGDAYRRAGVDIDAGNEFVQAIAPLAATTARTGSGGVLGGFGGAFDLREAGFHDPILIAANDGVGTKLAIAIWLSDPWTLFAPIDSPYRARIFLSFACEGSVAPP